MTLNITVVGPQGIWQCADHRATQQNGNGFRDTRNKHVIDWLPNGVVSITYAGLGGFRLGSTEVPLDTWLANAISGEDDEGVQIRWEGAGSVIQRVGLKASTDLGYFLRQERIAHVFSVAVIEESRPSLWMITNVDLPFNIGTDQLPRPDFHGYKVFPSDDEPDADSAFMIVPGNVVAQTDVQRIARVAEITKKHPRDLELLLADVNQRAALSAQAGGPISGSCTTTHIPVAAASVSSTGHVFYSDHLGSPSVLTPKTLVWGVPSDLFQDLWVETYRDRPVPGTMNVTLGQVDQPNKEDRNAT